MALYGNDEPTFLFSYRDNARLLKRKLETYPHDPAELFLRHIEFASEFGPLQELSLASAEMPLYKYYNVDVLALVLTALVATLALTHRMVSLVSFFAVFRKTKTE